jgi:hypothetical protein
MKAIAAMLSFSMWLALQAGGGGAPEVNHFKSSTANVDASSVKQIVGTLYVTVELSWSFANRTSVWLEGIGTVPAVGQLKYSTATTMAHFKSAKGGAELAMVPLSAAGSIQGPPGGAPFPPTIGNLWTLDATPIQGGVALPAGVLSLAKELGSDTPPDLKGLNMTPCRPDDEGCIVSEWTRISAPGANIQVDLSLMITYVPVTVTKNGKRQQGEQVKLFYTARQAFLTGSQFTDLSEQSKSLRDERIRGYRKVLTKSVGAL